MLIATQPAAPTPTKVLEINIAVSFVDIANPKEPKVPNIVLMQANNFLDPRTSDPIPIGILKRICPIA